MTAFGKTARQVRQEAAEAAKWWAQQRERDGDPEGAECFRMLSREIKAIQLRDRRP